MVEGTFDVGPHGAQFTNKMKVAEAFGTAKTGVTMSLPGAERSSNLDALEVVLNAAWLMVLAIKMKTCFVEISDHHAIRDLINDYIEELELIGTNPFKSM